MDSIDCYTLKVSDDGVGKKTTSSGFGTKLINLLFKQLDAQVTNGNDGGYWTQIEKV